MKKLFYIFLSLLFTSCTLSTLAKNDISAKKGSLVKYEKKNFENTKLTRIDTLNLLLVYKDEEIDSLYKNIEGLNFSIDSLRTALEISNSRVAVNQDFQIPDSIMFAGRVFNLKNERIFKKFEEIYRAELKSAHKFIPKSGRYFPLIDSVFYKYKVPLDAKYLAIAESRLNPMATSHVGASGTWQFMKKTALGYGMKINEFVDERRDIIKSTDSAAKYLRNSYEYLKERGIEDWLLAMSAYNAGVGSVSRIAKQQGGKDFFDVILRVDETNKYVWRAVAIKMIFDNEKEIFGKKFDRDTPLFDDLKIEKLTLKGYYKIDEWAKLHGTAVGKIWENNPWIKIHKRKRRKYSPVNDLILPPGNFSILVPKSAVKNEVEIARIEKSFLKKNEGYYSFHTVKKGDSLYKIARKYKTTISKIKNLNNLRSNTIYPGQKLRLKGTTATKQYTVKKGDSVSKKAQMLGISTQKLISKNNLKMRKGIVIIHP